jgi:hypothetical protein
MTPCDELKDQFLDNIAPKIQTLANNFNWGGLFALIDDAVEAVEVARGAGNGPEKKACVIDIVLAVYDRSNFDIPYLPRMVEKDGLRILLDVAIDGIVEILNRRGVFVQGAEGVDPT